jgi:5-methylthioribose kinase
MEQVHPDVDVRMEQKIGAVYQPLTEQTVVAYIRPFHLFETTGNLRVREVGDGNLNLVFRVWDVQTNQSLIVKQALPYAKIVGESWPLTLDRARIEGEALKKEAEYVPDLVPEVIHRDGTMALTVMEDLSRFTILRKGLIEGQQYPCLAKHIGTFLAKMLFFTSDLALPLMQKKEEVKRFINPELCKITEGLIFTDPFFDYPTNRFPEALRPAVEEVWQDTLLKSEVAQLKQQFLTEAEALLHGDLHSGSVFVTQAETKVIDPEFAFYGPMGFDIGLWIANLILNYLSQCGHSLHEGECSKRQKYLEQVMIETWSQFKCQFIDLLGKQGIKPFMKVKRYREAYLQKIWMDTIGFAGCEMIRRTVGLARVADLESIAEPELQLACKRMCIHLGVDLIKNRALVHTPEELIQRLQKAFQEASTKWNVNVHQSSDQVELDAEHYRNHSSIQFEQVRELLEGYSFKENSQILDVGCGDGRITAEIAQHVPKGHVLGMDISANMIQFAQQSFHLDKHPNLRFSIGNAENISDQEKFDVIVSFSCLHWVRQIRGTLAKLVKALRTKGHLLIITCPKESNWWIYTQHVLEKRKWQSYCHTSAYHSMLTSIEYLQILGNLGMKLLAQKLKEQLGIYIDKNALKAFIKGWLACFASIPAELGEDFLEDVAEEAIRDKVEKNDGKIHLQWKVLMMKWQKV